MAGIDDLIKGESIVGGLVIGLGVVVLAPALKPLVRPLAKSLVRVGVEIYDQGRVAMAELSERAEDMVAEVRAEKEHEEPKSASVEGERVSSPGNGHPEMRPT